MVLRYVPLFNNAMAEITYSNKHLSVTKNYRNETAISKYSNEPMPDNTIVLQYNTKS